MSRTTCINVSTACPRPCPEDCSGYAEVHEDDAADRAREDAAEQHDEYEPPMYEDAACGNPCGGEPLMCARCPELMGSDEPPDPADYWERDPCDDDDGEGCPSCEDNFDKCSYCACGPNIDYSECPVGVPMCDRPGYDFMVRLLVHKGLAAQNWDAENKITKAESRARMACRIACESCDYGWMRERIDRGGRL